MTNNTNRTILYEKNHFFDRLIWLFPLTFLAHIYEESHGFAEWVSNTLHGKMIQWAFYMNNFAFVLLTFVLCYLINKKKSQGLLFLLFLWVSGQTFWDALFHIFEEFHLNTYSPGYFTSIFLYLPVYGYLSYLALRERFFRPRLWIIAFVTSPLLLLFVIWAGLYHFQSIPWRFLF